MPDITALSEDLLTRIARLVDIDAMEEVISAGDARTAAADDDDDGGAGSETRAAGAEPASPPSSSSALRLRRDATEFERLISRMYKQKVASRFFQAQQSTDAPTDASAPLLAGGPPSFARHRAPAPCSRVPPLNSVLAPGSKPKKKLLPGCGGKAAQRSASCVP